MILYSVGVEDVDGKEMQVERRTRAKKECGETSFDRSSTLPDTTDYECISSRPQPRDSILNAPPTPAAPPFVCLVTSVLLVTPDELVQRQDFAASPAAHGG